MAREGFALMVLEQVLVVSPCPRMCCSTCGSLSESIEVEVAVQMSGNLLCLGLGTAPARYKEPLGLTER